jgi:hypothetical protein
MQQFTFNIDQKTTMWTRSTKHIEAGTQEEADLAFKEIQDWLASGLAQLVMEL